jgi:hypothetical protein
VPAVSCNDRKHLLHDFPANNIDLLICALSCHDRGVYRSCLDIQIVYDNFVHVIQAYIKQCIPVKTVRLGRRDPDYITPLNKSLLNKRSKLMKTGKKEAAEILASDINHRIASVLCHRLGKLAESGVKDVWNAIKANNGTTSNRGNNLILNVESTNKHFANISFDQHYLESVTAFRREPGDLNSYMPLNAYGVEPMLRRVTETAVGSDNIPYRVFCNRLFELSDVDTHIFNCSLGAGILPVQWLSSVITHVLKVANPATLTDFRPISVTSIISDVVGKLVVTRWLRLAYIFICSRPVWVPAHWQQNLRTCIFMHHIICITTMLKIYSYVRCLLINFSKAFDSLNHAVLLDKLDKLCLPAHCLNWLRPTAFLTGRTHSTKFEQLVSTFFRLDFFSDKNLQTRLFIRLDFSTSPLFRLAFFQTRYSSLQTRYSTLDFE